MHQEVYMRLSRPSPAMVVACLALFIALTGSAVAAKLVTGKQIKNSSITSVDVRNGGLKRADLAADALPVAGAMGATGAIGPQGPKGDSNTGPAGPQGPRGDTVTVDGKSVVGPKGDKGDKGDPGPAGTNGDTGAQGPQGPAGAQGPQGSFSGVRYVVDDGNTVECAAGEVAVSGGPTSRSGSYYDAPMASGTTPTGWVAYYDNGGNGVYAICAR
jgi:hypothetical protein